MSLKKANLGQIHNDRLSNLPTSILHNVLCRLSFDEACRTTILCKRWLNVWSTGFVLDFDHTRFESTSDVDERKPIQRFTDFVDKTLNRYSEQSLSIKKVNVVYPDEKRNMRGRLDKWLGIVAHSQVEELRLFVHPFKTNGTPCYELPSIFLKAKSLKSMKICRTKISNCSALKLSLLQCLELSEVAIEEDMLRCLIESCPLKKLRLDKCVGLENIWIPRCSGLESFHVARTINSGGRIVVDTPSFRDFTYEAFNVAIPRPFTLSANSMKNLTALALFFVIVTDDFVQELTSHFLSVKKIGFYNCILQDELKIVSQTLEQLDVNDCLDLANIMIDAPTFVNFCYVGDLQLSSVISSHGKCNAHICLNLDDLDMLAFLGIRRLLSRSNCRNVLSIILRGSYKIEFDRKYLKRIHDGSCDVEELKLSLLCPIPLGDTLSELIDGLFWSCRPAMLSLPIELRSYNVAGFLVDKLEEKVKNWKHPLKRFESLGLNPSDLLGPSGVQLQLRLFW